MPLCILLIYFTWPWFVQAWVQNVTSNAAGGLPRWPVRLMLPVGFAVLLLQGIAEIIKCVAGAHHRLCPRIRLREAGAMIDLLRENMAPVLFGGLVLFLLIGYPAAFSLAAVGLFGGLVAIELGLIAPNFLGNLTYQLYGVLSNELLLAIPFFTFMGVILEKSGLAEDLLDGFGQLFGGVRGGLSYAVIIVGAILGAITGTVAASVIAMGLISLPVMMRYGYNIRHATGVIAASGTITQLIPPSLVLIVLADQLQKSPGEMYIGATGASIVQVLLFMGWVFILSIIRPQDVPALPPEARTLQGWPLWAKIIRGTVPSLALIFIVLGTILLGPRHPHRGRRHGRCRRHGAGLVQWAAELAGHLGRAWCRPCGLPPWWCSSSWAPASSLWCSRASAAVTGSSICSPTCRAAWSAS